MRGKCHPGGEERLRSLQEEMIQCEACPRLVEYRQQVAQKKRRSYRDWQYWGKPVPSLGTSEARLLIVGLAPAAHGGNRTGRVFTGDRSGDFLFETLYRFGFCNQPQSRHLEDSLVLRDTYITAALHCAPPANKPVPGELLRCRHFLKRELELLQEIRVVVALGRVAWQAYLVTRKELGWPTPYPAPKFAHGAAYPLDGKTMLMASYHPSQQNTLTGRLTRDMFDQVFAQAQQLLSQL